MAPDLEPAQKARTERKTAPKTWHRAHGDAFSEYPNALVSLPRILRYMKLLRLAIGSLKQTPQYLSFGLLEGLLG